VSDGLAGIVDLEPAEAEQLGLDDDDATASVLSSLEDLDALDQVLPSCGRDEEAVASKLDGVPAPTQKDEDMVPSQQRAGRAATQPGVPGRAHAAAHAAATWAGAAGSPAGHSQAASDSVADDAAALPGPGQPGQQAHGRHQRLADHGQTVERDAATSASLPLPLSSADEGLDWEEDDVAEASTDLTAKGAATPTGLSTVATLRQRKDARLHRDPGPGVHEEASDGHAARAETSCAAAAVASPKAMAGLRDGDGGLMDEWNEQLSAQAGTAVGGEVAAASTDDTALGALEHSQTPVNAHVAEETLPGPQLSMEPHQRAQQAGEDGSALTEPRLSLDLPPSDLSLSDIDADEELLTEALALPETDAKMSEQGGREAGSDAAKTAHAGVQPSLAGAVQQGRAPGGLPVVSAEQQLPEQATEEEHRSTDSEGDGPANVGAAQTSTHEAMLVPQHEAAPAALQQESPAAHDAHLHHAEQRGSEVELRAGKSQEGPGLSPAALEARSRMVSGGRVDQGARTGAESASQRSSSSALDALTHGDALSRAEALERDLVTGASCSGNATRLITSYPQALDRAVHCSAIAQACIGSHDDFVQSQGPGVTGTSCLGNTCYLFSRACSPQACLGAAWGVQIGVQCNTWHRAACIMHACTHNRTWSMNRHLQLNGRAEAGKSFSRW
jgi:hypothetical protein